MIITAEFLGSLLDPPFALHWLDVWLAGASFITALAIGAVIYLLALFGPGMRL